MPKLQIDGVDIAHITTYESNRLKSLHDAFCVVNNIEYCQDIRYNNIPDLNYGMFNRLPKIKSPISTGEAIISLFWEQYENPVKKPLGSDGGLVSSFCLEYDHKNGIE